MVTSNFINIIKKAIDCSKFTKKVKIGFKKKPWITADLILLMKQRDLFYKKYKRNKTEESFYNYKLYRNLIVKLVTQQKQNFYKNQFLNNKGNSKKLWQTFNEYTTINYKNKNDSDSYCVLNENNTLEEDPLKVSNIFNNYYSKIGEKMSNDIKTNLLYDLNELAIELQNRNSFFLTPVTEDEIISLSKSLKDNSAPGFDEITSLTIKNILPFLAKPICNLINLIFEKGVCPEHFKTAIVKPIFKKGESQLIENFRPISLLSNISKIFEKAFKNRLVKFLTKNNQLSKKQFGFQNNKSTNDAISLLTTKIAGQLDMGRPCAAVFVDLAKAFDTVCHRKLLSKVEHAGVRGPALSLLESYLGGRQQMVKIDNYLSQNQLVTYGIPQGTVLGPILFIIYINDLLNQNYHGELISFADDTVLLVGGDSWIDVEQKIASDVQKMVKWFDSHLLTINLQKTQYLPFSNKKQFLPPNKTITVTLPFRRNKVWELESVNQANYLGIVLDNHLKWNLQIQLITTKLGSLIYIFKQISKIMDINSLRAIYFSLVQSILSYGIVGWGGAYDTTIKPLQIIQKRIIKVMYGLDKRFPSDQLFQACKILSVKNIYYKASLTQLIKTNCFNRTIYCHTTRFRINDNLILPRFNTTVGQQSHTYVGHKLFNLLPPNIKNKIHNNNFKTVLTNWLISDNPTI